MIRQLYSARAKELAAAQKGSVTANDFKGTLSGLYKRGFLNFKRTYLQGKRVDEVYITPAGVSFLRNHNGKIAGNGNEVSFSFSLSEEFPNK